MKEEEMDWHLRAESEWFNTIISDALKDLVESLRANFNIFNTKKKTNFCYVLHLNPL